MQDVNLNDIADEIHIELELQGVTLPAPVVRALVHHFFKFMQEEMIKPDRKFSMFNRDITHIFQEIDVEGLCNELAVGEKNIVTYDHLLRKNALQPRAARFLRKRMKNTIE